MNDEWSAGDVVCGRYRVVERLGSGRFGTVYKVVPLEAGSQGHLTIKRIAAAETGSPELLAARQRLMTETLALAGVGHPSVVRAISVEPHDNGLLIVQEYLPGESLALLCAERAGGMLNPLELVELALALTDALGECHGHGLLHGDIRPDNICFRDAARTVPVLVDFGMAALMDAALPEETRTGFEDLAFLPPERSGFLQEPVTAASDFYSLGVTLHRCATGTSPFQGTNPRELISAILSTVPLPLHEVLQDFPHCLSDVIARLLRKNPRGRYQSATGLAADLRLCRERILSGNGHAAFALGRQDRVRELNTRVPLVGRTAELESLKRILERGKPDAPAAAFVSAPSGMGKSRLVAEAVSYAQSLGYQVAGTKISLLERHVPLSAMNALLEAFERLLNAAGEEAARSWRQRLQEQLGPKCALLAREFKRFSHLFGVRPSHRAPQECEQATLEAISALLGQLAVHPARSILVLDDLQWADDLTTKVIFQALSAGTIGTDIVLLGTFRSNEVAPTDPLHSVAQVPHVIRVELAPLSREESNALVEHLLDETGAEVERLRDRAHVLTAGNPYHLFEFLKSALEQGVFAPVAGSETWQFHPELAARMELGGSVEGLLAQRIGQLEALPRQLLQAASIVGNTVPLETVRALVEAGSVAIALALQLLAQENLVLRKERELVFCHDKVREAAYALLQENARRNLHDRYARHLVAHHGTSEELPVQEALEIAVHLIQGHLHLRPAESRLLLWKAARAAFSIFAFARAKDLLRTASLLLEPEPENREEWIRIYELWADAMACTDEIARALERYDEILPHVRDRLHRAEIFLKKCNYSLGLFHYDEALSAGRAALATLGVRWVSSRLHALLRIVVWMPVLALVFLAASVFRTRRRPLGDRLERLRCEALLAAGRPVYFVRPLVGIALLLPHCPRFIFLEECRLKALFVSYWGILFGTLGLERFARRCYEHGFDYFRRNPSPEDHGFLLMVQGFNLEFSLGNISRSLEMLDEGARMLSRVGETMWRAMILQYIIGVDLIAAGTGRARGAREELQRVHQQVGFEPTIAGIVVRQLQLEERGSDLAQWLTQVRQSRERLIQRGFLSIDVIHASIWLGDVHLMREELEPAEELLHSAFRMMLGEMHRLPLALYSPFPLADCYLRMGKIRKALLPLLVLASNAWLLGHRIFRPHTLWLAGEILWKMGMRRLGRRCHESALHLTRRHGWAALHAEGEFRLGRLLLHGEPEYAEFLLRRALQFHRQLGHDFLAKRILAALGDLTGRQGTSQLPPAGATVRAQVEFSSLVEMFLKISSITDLNALLAAVLECLCEVSGAEVGIIFLSREQGFVPAVCRNVSLEQYGGSWERSAELDQEFLRRFIAGGAGETATRNSHEGSVLALPLRHKEFSQGFVYLANKNLTNLFDRRGCELLSALAAQATIALQNLALLSEREEKAKLHAELAAAKAVQDALLPEQPAFHGVSAATHYQSATVAGGDWYGTWHDAESNTLLVYIGDVTGHGIPSALMTGVVCGAVFSSEFLWSGRDGSSKQTDPAARLLEIALTVNDVVYRTSTRSGLLATMLFLSLNLETGELIVLNAAHVHPFHRRLNGTVSPVLAPGSLLGYKVVPTLKPVRLRLEPGELILIFTDGLIENTSRAGESLTLRDLRGILEQGGDPQAVKSRILRAAEETWGEHPQADDVTFVCFSWDGPELRLQ